MNPLFLAAHAPSHMGDAAGQTQIETESVEEASL